jgi:dephospho-CoA kinase
VVGVVGLAGSGKSTVCRHLAAGGFELVYFGGVVLAEVAARGLERSQESERAVREELRAAEGMAVMATRSLPAIRAGLEAGRSVVIDGIYSVAEVDALTESLGDRLLSLAVHAPSAARAERIGNRGDRGLSAEELHRRDAAELQVLDKARPIVMADLHVVNAGTEAELCSAVEASLDAEFERRGF